MDHLGFDFLDFSRLPRAADPDQAALGLERFHEAAEATEKQGLAEFVGALSGQADGRRLADAVFGNSPFLSLAAAREPGFLHDLAMEGPDAVFESVLRSVQGPPPMDAADEDVARALRQAKRRVALTVAIADIAGAWPLERVTGALSDFAAASLGRAVGHALRATARTGAFELPHPDDPERESGLIVLGMGKLGARELNYSSDIDIILFYDPDRIRTDQPHGLQAKFVRLARLILRLMDERTADGYVFRTDLRLRPDPGATPIAISTHAAESYYETLGQNWERAAMIKVRPVAGDLEAGDAFVKGLGPFVWRRNLDFASIRDIHSIKRQINAHRGGSEIAVAGHNVKLGRGGIREIEFFAQTQQLIWGGKEPRLRASGTIEALESLVEAGRVERAAADELTAAYRFLRTVEHRLQMIGDDQTHVLPDDERGLEAIAAFLGFDGAGDFSDALLAHLRVVEGHYAALFEDSPDLSAGGADGGNLVFTGADPDPDTMTSLGRIGFKNVLAVDAAVRGWHHGRYRATRSTRSREILTELMPRLLSALGGAQDPDGAFSRFDMFLARLPSGVQLFSMIYANPHLLELMADVMGGAPKLADHLAHSPNVLESVLSGDFFDAPPRPEALDEELDRLLAQAQGAEDILDISRRWAADRRFQVGVQTLQGMLTAREASLALSNIADAALSRLLPRVEEEFARRHGRPPGGGMAIVAMGKLGGREMTAASDLDMIFVYDAPDLGAPSDGDRPLVASQYFARLSQRMINAINAQTTEGVLFEVDMRLRPSGNAGPIASSLAAFERYQKESAWTWEHMALTRARVVAGPPELRDKLNRVISDAICVKRDPDALLRDVADMRMRMDRERHSDFIWKIKDYRGGLVDVEFIAQHLILANAHDHPDVSSPSTRQALANLRDAGLLGADHAERLIEAVDLWQTIQGALRLTIEGALDHDREDEVCQGLRSILRRNGEAGDFHALKARAERTAETVLGIYREIIEAPAGLGS